MTSPDPQLWERARQAQDRLAAQLLDHPDVSLIDIGYPVDQVAAIEPPPLVLRVHVRRSMSREALGLPAELDGFPIQVVEADYRLE